MNILRKIKSFDIDIYKLRQMNSWLRPLSLVLSFSLILGVLSNVKTLVAQEQQKTAKTSLVDISVLSDEQLKIKEFSLHILPLTQTELSELAKSWLKLTQKEIMQLSSLKLLLTSTEGSEREQLEAAIDEIRERRGRLFRKFNQLLDDWEMKGAKPEEVAEYRKYLSAIVRKEFASSDTKTFWRSIKTWSNSSDSGNGIARSILSLILSLLAAFVFALLARSIVARFILRKRRLSTLLRDFLARVSFWIVLLIGIILALSMNGINMTPLLAAFGGASFVIAFATQSTLSNLASGFMLMITQPFDVGDSVKIANVAGKVHSINTVSTVITSDADEIIIVPNTKVWDSVIVNFRQLDAEN